MLIVPVAAISPDTGPKLRMMISSSDKDIHIPYVEIPAQKFKAFAAGRPDLIEAPDVEPENQVSAEPALNNPSLEARSADFENFIIWSYDVSIIPWVVHKDADWNFGQDRWFNVKWFISRIGVTITLTACDL